MANNRRIDDPALLRLLWQVDEEPSTRSGLTTDAVVEAGVALADERGLDGLTMRAVAERLGVGTMSLYTYVPGKEELVLLMQHRAIGELLPGARVEGWRAGLRTMAEEHWGLYMRHPWLLDVPLRRPALGPNHLDRYEHELRIVDGIGLTDHEMNAAIELVQGHVAGAAKRLRSIRSDADASGMSDDEWWYSVLPTLTQVLADRDYPVSGRVGQAIGAPHLDTSYLLEFGLERILDGLEALAESRRGERAPEAR